MFRITRKADYAVFILSYLARRANEEGRDALVSAQELASFSALNKSLVANLLKDLTRGGFLNSVRGARGGYRLGRSPREISLGQILRAVEGPFTFVECAADHDAPPSFDLPPRAAEAPLGSSPVGGAPVIDHDACNLAGICQSKGPLLVLHARIQQLLDDLKLVELAGIETRGIPAIPTEYFPSRALGQTAGFGTPLRPDAPGGGNGTGHGPVAGRRATDPVAGRRATDPVAEPNENAPRTPAVGTDDRRSAAPSPFHTDTNLRVEDSRR
jgi:Rrf2 family protein